MKREIVVDGERSFGLDKGELFVVDVEDDPGAPEQFVEDAKDDVRRTRFAEVNNLCRVGRYEQ